MDFTVQLELVMFVGTIVFKPLRGGQALEMEKVSKIGYLKRIPTS